jgi:hypothetical protein
MDPGEGDPQRDDGGDDRIVDDDVLGELRLRRV